MRVENSASGDGTGGDADSRADEAVETLGAEAGDGDGDGEDDYSEDQNEAEVEEEIEEVLEEADDDDDRDDEGRDFQKSYREVNTGAGSQATVQIIREVLDRSMLTEVSDGASRAAVAGGVAVLWVELGTGHCIGLVGALSHRPSM